MSDTSTKMPVGRDAIAWHVDSWDTRGGICFACFGSMAAHALESSELQSVVIAPPDFKPVQLGDRALSLAAIRSGSFQDGLYLQGRSVPFAALADLVEFVRRSYSGSAAADDPDGRDGPPPRPVEPGPGSEGPGSPEGLLRPDRQSASSALAGSYREFNAVAATLELGSKAQEFSWNLNYLREGSTGATDQCLLRALWLTFDELLNRAWNLADEHLLNWWRAAYAWSDMVQRLHLAEEFIHLSIRGGVVGSLAYRIERVRANIGDGDIGPSGPPELLVAEFLHRIGLCSTVFWEYGPHPWEIWGIGPISTVDETAYGALWRVPTPAQTAGQFNAMRSLRERELSLGHFMSGAMSAPAMFPDAMAAQHWADLVLLCSASIAAGAGKDHGAQSVGRRRRMPTLGHERLRQAHRREVIAAAGAWLAKSLPLLALPAPVERLVFACVASR